MTNKPKAGNRKISASTRGDAKRHRTLREISQERISRDDISRIASELRAMSDRPAAIIAATLVEDAVQEVLLRRMKNLSVSEFDVLFSGAGALASFSSKIRVANAFKLLATGWAKEIEIIKNIRNVFAHARSDVDFSTVEIVAQTLKITTVNLYRNPDWGLPNKGANNPAHQVAMSMRLHDPRSRFIGSCLFFAYLLWDARFDPEDFDEDDE